MSSSTRNKSDNWLSDRIIKYIRKDFYISQRFLKVSVPSCASATSGQRQEYWKLGALDEKLLSSGLANRVGPPEVRPFDRIRFVRHEGTDLCVAASHESILFYHQIGFNLGVLFEINMNF